MGIRGKLISIFILIKVIPLVVLAWFALEEIYKLCTAVRQQSVEMVAETRELVSQIGGMATESSIVALDTKSRENIERLTTDTARAVAAFLYERDSDILLASRLTPSENSFRIFLAPRRRDVISHQPWSMNEEGTDWLPPRLEETILKVTARNPDNSKDFHYRPPEDTGIVASRPLYLEMTFVDTDGWEKIKVTTTDLLPKELRYVADPRNTWCRAETYFRELGKLAPGEVYVSEVIGPYLPSPLIGPYTKKRCQERGIPFAPEEAAYAGKENPRGKRFQGLIRWATPVTDAEGTVTGYVTLALDHTHIMEFTDHLVPTDERYSPISDAASGNYAFMWDYRGRNISHPRDYFIVGYDPETGEPAVPWLSSEVYEAWQESNLSFAEFARTAPWFADQSLDKKPAGQLTDRGMLGLDGRFLNFAPQCSGWHNLTRYGGSGSFVIFWSNLWKLTTAATIPYFTGLYQDSPRGFGYVTIGANVHEFHRAATETAEKMALITDNYDATLARKSRETKALLTDSMRTTAQNLTISTLLMIAIVIFIAIWMASTLTGKITALIQGIKRFQSGDHTYRLAEISRDEMGQLSHAFNEMSDKLQESMEEMRQAKERAEESDRTKSFFLANMSHEIRTPLNGIMGMTDLLANSPLDATQKKHLDAIKISSSRLLAIINDILDLSRINAGKFDIVSAPFHLAEALDSVLQILALKAREKDLELDCLIGSKVPQRLIGDQNRLLQIIINLVNNAIKFTEKGSITLQVSTERIIDNEEALLRFSVRDTGIGIPPDKQKLIFQAFSQADSSHVRQFGGTGLGLTISSELVDLMGGEIGVESEPGRGSTFWFTARFGLDGDKEPDSADRSPRTEDPARDQNVFAGLTVLLVEDEVINCMMTKAMLKQTGMVVDTAESGLQALEICAEKQFDAILMDIQMPDMDGFETTVRLRELEKGRERQTPVIALTAHAMQGYREKCLAAGMDDYVTKPIDKDDLYAAIARHTGRPSP